MGEKLIVIGAGGHARSIIDIIQQNNVYEVIGCIDNCYGQRNSVEGMGNIPIIGNDNMLADLKRSGIRNCFIALGNGTLRVKLYHYILELGYTPINVVSQYAIVSPRVTLGKGICIMPGAILNVNVTIEDSCIINTKCSIDHDCTIGKNSHVAPGVTLSGAVKVGNNVHIGTGSCIIDGVSIGDGAYIGAGAVVVRDINPGVMAYGNPAREIRKL
jgi:UDP-perosamine 4-acetyltransferase